MLNCCKIKAVCIFQFSRRAGPTALLVWFYSILLCLQSHSLDLALVQNPAKTPAMDAFGELWYICCTPVQLATGMRNFAQISTLDVIGIGWKQLPAPAQHGALPASCQYPIFTTSITTCIWIIFLHHLHYITSLTPPPPSHAFRTKILGDIFQNPYSYPPKHTMCVVRWGSDFKKK